jgi:hypothetical protein
MAQQLWPLHNSRPIIEIALAIQPAGQLRTFQLLADTGAGSTRSGFELILDEQDCLLAGGSPAQASTLGGAYSGTFPVYLVRVQIPQLGFDRYVRVVGVPQSPVGFDGIACFRFLNRFTYGNFGDLGRFGLEI